MIKVALKDDRKHEENGTYCYFLLFFLRDFIFKKTIFEKLQYLKQEQYCYCATVWWT